MIVIPQSFTKDVPFFYIYGRLPRGKKKGHHPNPRPHLIEEFARVLSIGRFVLYRAARTVPPEVAERLARLTIEERKAARGAFMRAINEAEAQKKDPEQYGKTKLRRNSGDRKDCSGCENKECGILTILERKSRPSNDRRARSSLYAIIFVSSFRSIIWTEMGSISGRNPMARCVYTVPSGMCDGSSPFDRKGEHWFPRGLGQFRGFRELQGKVCKACNNRFGRELEDVFLHCGPEALFREIAGSNLRRKSHEKHNIFERGSNKHPPVRELGEDPDAKRAIMWEVGPNNEAKPQRQVVIIGPEGEVEHIRLGGEAGAFLPRVSELLKQKGKLGFKVEQFFGDSDEDCHQVEALCSEIFGKRPVAFRTGEAGQVIHGSSRFQLTPTYFRAITKIGFHTFLHFYPHLTGFEPEFDAIKQFIFKGDEENRYVLAGAEPLLNAEGLQAPAHAIACDWNQHSLEARIQLFAGLESRMQVAAGTVGGPGITTRQGNLVWVVRLGPNPSRLVFEDRRGVVLRYFKQCEGGFHGEMTDLPSGEHCRSRDYFPPSRDRGR